METHWLWLWMSRSAALLLQQCQALLTDPATAARLRVLQRYPSCGLKLRPSLTVAADFVLSADNALKFLINFMHRRIHRNIPGHAKISVVAASQQQLLALSAAVARPAFMYGSEVGLPEWVDRPPATIYLGAALLAEIADLSAESLHHAPVSICQPAGLAAVVTSGAVSALAFAAVDSCSGRRPPDIERDMQACMRYAANAARFLHVLAQQLLKPSSVIAAAARSALTSQGAAQSLLQLLLWLSEPATATATASGVLAEALAALLLMAVDKDMRQVLTAADGPHEWEAAAAALRRRLPRRMAARFLPEVDRVSAAVAGRSGNAAGSVAHVDAAALAAAEAAMAELLQVCAAMMAEYSAPPVSFQRLNEFRCPTCSGFDGELTYSIQ